MIRGRSVPILAGLTLAIGACADGVGPTAPAGERTQVSTSPTVAELDRAIPGFGGFYYDDTGRPTLFLLPSADRVRARQLLQPALAARGMAGDGLQVVEAQFAWGDLDRWFGDLSTEVLGYDGVVWVDADEAANRVQVGVTDMGAVARVNQAAMSRAIPTGALLVTPTEPIELMASLRAAHRPTLGGVQINFPGFLCTLGFNASDGGQASFITNSHCTTNQGGVDNTPYWQPLQSTNPTQLATEVEDPVFVGGGACPAGRRCRRSDASRARYDDLTGFQLGRIARTGSSKNGSLEVVGHWTITAADDQTDAFPIGTTINKVGRTTGWSAGRVSNSCVNVGISGTDIVLFCQTLVKAKVNSGDSGSPTFIITDGTNVRLVGILWGGGGGSFVFSPLKNIEADLGSLTVF